MSLASRPKGGFPPRGKARSAKADAFVMRKAVPASAPWDRDAAAQRLAAACQALGAGLPVERQAQLLDYLAQLQRWNRTYNLTALRDPDQMLVQHLFDSLAVLAPLARFLSEVAAPRLMDVGSGAGLPGVVLAIARPDWQVCCVDAVEKKTAFVNQMAAVLHLPNLSARHARVETLDPAGCDVVISRAFACLEDFAALAGRHVRPGGTLLAMKGRHPEDEIRALHDGQAWQVQRVQPLDVPELQAQRCLIWMCRKGSP